MSEFEKLKNILRGLDSRFAPKPRFTRGLLGSGQGFVKVPGKPDHNYVRFNRGATEFFEIFNTSVPAVDGWPVLIGEFPWQPGLTQIVGTDWSSYERSSWGDTIGGTSLHANTHEWPDGQPGSDPLNVHMRSIVSLKGFTSGSGSTTFLVNSYDYQSAGTGTTWTGLPGVDFEPIMTASVTGSSRLMGVFLDPSTNTLGIITGTIGVFTDAFDPPRPVFPASIFPVSWVRVYGGQAGLVERDIRDARRLFQKSEGTTRDRSLYISGGFGASIVAKSTTYTATINDHVITGDATDGAFTITLPALSELPGLILHIKKIDASGNAVTIDGSGAETIDGATTQVLSTQYDNKMIVAGASEWHVI